MFKIGENIILKNTYSNVSIKNTKISVLSPSRLHLTAMNPNKMILEQLGGRWDWLSLRFKKYYNN